MVMQSVVEMCLEVSLLYAKAQQECNLPMLKLYSVISQHPRRYDFSIHSLCECASSLLRCIHGGDLSNANYGGMYAS